eukprot:UC1_evm1s912
MLRPGGLVFGVFLLGTVFTVFMYSTSLKSREISASPARRTKVALVVRPAGGSGTSSSNTGTKKVVHTTLVSSDKIPVALPGAFTPDENEKPSIVVAAATPLPRFVPSLPARRPYPTTRIQWGTCGSKTRVLTDSLEVAAASDRWRAIISSDSNPNYLAFVPSAAAHWRKLGAKVVLALVVDQGEDIALTLKSLSTLDGVEVRVLEMPNDSSLPKGHAAKVARGFLSTQFDSNDVITIMDIDYYLLKYEEWRSHLKCVPSNSLLALGYNRYFGTKDEGKYPMYLGTARSQTFSHFLNPSKERNFGRWIQGFKGMHVYDSQEDPFQPYGAFSDESLFRAMLARHPVPVSWLNTPSSWRRIDRQNSGPVSQNEIRMAWDVFPNRPLADCKLYKTRLLPVHKWLGIDDPARDATFIELLRSSGFKSRDWGQGSFQAVNDLRTCLQLPSL